MGFAQKACLKARHALSLTPLLGAAGTWDVGSLQGSQGPLGVDAVFLEDVYPTIRHAISNRLSEAATFLDVPDRLLPFSSLILAAVMVLMLRYLCPPQCAELAR